MRWSSLVRSTLLVVLCVAYMHTSLSEPYPNRRILLFPFGNSNAPPNDTVSVYLDYADPKRAPEGWHACAQFAFVISNSSDPTILTVSRTYLPHCNDDRFLTCLFIDAHHRFIASSIYKRGKHGHLSTRLERPNGCVMAQFRQVSLRVLLCH